MLVIIISVIVITCSSPGQFLFLRLKMRSGSFAEYSPIQIKIEDKLLSLPSIIYHGKNVIPSCNTQGIVLSTPTPFSTPSLNSDVNLQVQYICCFLKGNFLQQVHTAMNRQRRFSIQSVTLWSAPGTMTLKGGQPVKSYHPPIAGTLDRTWRRRNRREVQVVRTLVYLVVLFFVMWAPIFIVFVLIMRDGLLDAQQISSHSFLAAMCVAYCNAIINPLAYGLSTDKLRSYLKSVLDCSPLPRRPSLPPAVSNGGACRGVCGGADGCRNGVTSSKLPAKSSETSLS